MTRIRNDDHHNAPTATKRIQSKLKLDRPEWITKRQITSSSPTVSSNTDTATRTLSIPTSLSVTYFQSSSNLNYTSSGNNSLTSSSSPSAYPYNSSSTHTSSSSFTVSHSSRTSISSSGQSSSSISPYTATRTASATASSSSSSASADVPGVFLELNLAGSSETQAVYGVEITFGHGDDSDSKRRRKRDSLRKAKKQQKVNLQVDLGSSDLWVATKKCTSSRCSSAPILFDEGFSLSSGKSASISYLSGKVSGSIYWEQISLGEFGIGYQAFIGATTVTSEGLSGGNYTGVLGLSLPLSSTVLSKIGGTTGSSPDGATFLDNLFGSGSSAPSERLFSLSLERREDVRTISQLGIGAISTTLCPSPCNPAYMSIVPQPNLGLTGYLHWRIQMKSVSITTWSNEQAGTGATTRELSLGPSKVYVGKANPLAVLDSGGVQILVGSRSYADTIYNAYGIVKSSDGYYRMPCHQQIALTFNFEGQEIPIHPLDMSYVDPVDDSQNTCIGMLQYSSSLGETGDFILGSAFLKNVYSIYQYPDTSPHKTWRPSVGLIPLTNASTASQDFYSVRVLHESLSTVSSTQASANAGGSSAFNAAAGRKAVSSTVIAMTSVIGLFVVAAAAFCAWWFCLRRKFGAGGVVEYPRLCPSGSDHKSDEGGVTAPQSRKHKDTYRHKSMIDGYIVDYERDSWMSGTEGVDSIQLGYIAQGEEDNGTRPAGMGDCTASLWSSRSSSIAVDGVVPAEHDVVKPTITVPQTCAQTRSHSSDFPECDPSSSPSWPLYPSPYPYPPPYHAKTWSMSMSGPFPTSRGNDTFMSARGLGSSLMYDIPTGDYLASSSGVVIENGGKRVASVVGRCLSPAGDD